jgi:hypothetical protein
MQRIKSFCASVLPVALLLVFAAAGLGQTVGGYSKISATDDKVTAAADFAIDAQKEKQPGPLSLVEVLRAERQSVAGTNWRLCMQVKAADDDDAGVEPFTVEAIVFEKLPRAPGEKYSLTSWKRKECGK